MLIFAFQEGLKIHEISSSKLINKYCEEYIQKGCQHEAKNLAKRLPKPFKMDQISVPSFGLKRLGCLEAASLRSEHLKVSQTDPKKVQMAPPGHQGMPSGSKGWQKETNGRRMVPKRVPKGRQGRPKGPQNCFKKAPRWLLAAVLEPIAETSEN